MTTVANQQITRPLGALETCFWLSDQAGPKHIVTAVEIEGVASLASWRAAIATAQKRHPLLQSGIATDRTGQPHFICRPGVPIPITVIDAAAPFQLDRILEDELAERVSPTEEILARISIYEKIRSTYIFTAIHHSIGDSLSVSYFIRDILRVLAGETLSSYPMPPPQEAIVDVSALAPGKNAHELGRIGIADERVREMLRVHTRLLPQDLGLALRVKARHLGTTVHGAIVAALVLAEAEQAPRRRFAETCVMSPVNIRDLVGRTDEFALSVGTATGLLNPKIKGGFWALARKATALNAHVRSPQAFAATVADVNGFIASKPSPADVVNSELKLYPVDLMVSNLGALPFPSVIGSFEIKKLIGPVHVVGVRGEQMIGVSSIDGAIQLVQSSYSPIPLLLESVEDHLRKAITG